MSGSPSQPDSRPTNFRWVVFFLGCGTSWMLYLHRYTFALIKPKLAEEWELDKVDLGILDSAFSLFYMGFQIPGGILADVLGAHFFLGGIILLWSIALAMHAWAPNLVAMRYARIAFGIGQAGAFAALSRVTRMWFPSTVRTTVQGWIGVFFGRSGAACANLIFAAYLIGVLHLEWRTAIYLFALLGMVLGILFLLLFRDSPRDHPLVNGAEANLIEERPTQIDTTSANAINVDRSDVPASLGDMIRRMRVRSILNLLCVNLQATLSTIADAVYSAWIPMFLYEVHHLEFKEMGIYSSLPLIGGACGGVAGGFLNDYLIRRTGNRRWVRSGVGLAGKGLAGITLFVALYYYYDQPYAFCKMLLYAKFFSDASLATGWGTITDIGGKMSATVFGYNNAVAAGLALPAPIVYGYVAIHHGWYAVFVIVATIYIMCGLSWLLINCTIPLLAEDSRIENAHDNTD